MIRYLTKQQIIRINKATVDAHGGNFMPTHNFLHEENLDYQVEAVQAEMFGEPLYPTISDKAALYCYNIICNHIFTDGNKRTGLGAALQFLNLNNYDVSLTQMESLENEFFIKTSINAPSSTAKLNLILTAFILKIASGQSSLEECRAWFEAHTVLIKTD